MIWRNALWSILLSDYWNPPKETYKSGDNRYLSFCVDCNIAPLPLCELLLCKFFTYLSDQGLRFRSLNAFVSGLQFMQIREGQSNPFQCQHWPHVECITKGMKVKEA